MDTTDGELEARLRRARLAFASSLASSLAGLRLSAALARHVGGWSVGRWRKGWWWARVKLEMSGWSETRL